MAQGGGPQSPPPGRLILHPPPLWLLGVTASIFQRPLQDLCGGRGNGDMSPREGEGAAAGGGGLTPSAMMGRISQITSSHLLSTTACPPHISK